MSMPFTNVNTTFESFLQELPASYHDLALEFKALVLDFIAKNPFSTDKLVDYLQEHLELRKQLWEFLAKFFNIYAVEFSL